MPAIPTRHRVNPEKNDTRPVRRPDWIKVKAPQGDSVKRLKELIKHEALHTVCEEAFCPNLGECWGNGTATFLILGDVCTRSCGFCDVKRGKPLPLDENEPEHVMQAVQALQLKHTVITSVNRDELPDGGASVFANIIRLIHEHVAGCSVEVLIPDFKGQLESLSQVTDARPEILNHNIETVPSLFKKVQPQDRLEWSQAVLSGAKKLNPSGLTKSGIMVGLGESITEVKSTLKMLREWGVDILTIGQYLQPSRRHLPIERYYTLEEFAQFNKFGLDIGFRWVESGPLVRSSFHAANQVRALLNPKG
jgi:lipoic acid synthetase